MKLCVLFSISLGAWAQSANTTFITDLNGYRQAVLPSVSSDHTQTQISESINGTTVPLEQREEKVLRKDANGTLIETITRKFDPTGRLASTERQVIETNLTGNGGSSVHATLYRSDVNGREQEIERRNVDMRVSGTTTTVETVVARPTLNGGFDTAEKRSAITSGTDANRTTTESVYRAGLNGGLTEALRFVTQESKENGQSKVSIANYEPGISGALQLRSQSVSTTVKQADGTESTQVDLYAAAADGRVQEQGAPQQIKEEQLITRKKAANGSIVETLSVRRPTIADPNKLGGLQKISETVCEGKCDAPGPVGPPSVPTEKKGSADGR